VWNIVDCGLMGQSNGHHFWEASAIADELSRRGVVARIFCHKGRAVPHIPAAQVLPAFPLSLYNYVSQDPVWGYRENFVVHNRSFHRALAGITGANFSSSLVLMPNMTEWQLLGAIRWLAGFASHERPKTLMLLEPAYGWSNKVLILNTYQKIWAHCPAAIKRDIFLGVRTPILAEQFAPIFGFAPTVLPHAFALPESENLDPPGALNVNSEPMVVSFVAGARRERGAHLLPDIVEKCSSMGVRFVIQVRVGGDPGFDGTKLAELGERPNVQLYQGAMPAKDYYKLIASSVVLMAYDADRYQNRATGVYLEAKCLGAPMIVSPRNWLADEVKSFGNGIVCKERSADAIADAIMNAKGQIDDLRARAATVAFDFRSQHGVAHFVDSTLGLVGEGVS